MRPPWTLAKELFQSWESWRISSGHPHMTRTQLGTEVKRLGVEKKRGSAGMMYQLGVLASYNTIDVTPADLVQDEIPW